jgi:hypothetical protein
LAERTDLVTSLQSEVRSRDDAVIAMKQSLKEADITAKQLQLSIGKKNIPCIGLN